MIWIDENDRIVRINKKTKKKSDSDNNNMIKNNNGKMDDGDIYDNNLVSLGSFQP